MNRDLVRLRAARGLGQTPTSAATPQAVTAFSSGPPACADIDSQRVMAASSVVLGGLATAIGILGAVMSKEYAPIWGTVAGVGFVSMLGGVAQAITTAPAFVPNCEGPGMPALGGQSANPSQTTPYGQVVPTNP